MPEAQTGRGLALEAVESFNTSFHRDLKVFNAAGLRRHPLEFGGALWDSIVSRNAKIQNHVIMGDPMSYLNAIVPNLGALGSTIRYKGGPILNARGNHSLKAFEGQIDGF